MTWNFERFCYGCESLRREIAALRQELAAAQLRANTAIIQVRQLESRLAVAEPEHRKRRR
jgi:hypothetical protein